MIGRLRSFTVMKRMPDAPKTAPSTEGPDEYRPTSGEIDRMKDVEAQWRRSRIRAEVTIGASIAGLLATLWLSFWALQGWGYSYGPFILTVVISALAVGLPSVELLRRETFGRTENLRLPPPSSQYNNPNTMLEARHSQRQLLEAIERNGSITATRAALETSLTVEEAEQELSRLAEGGHLEVRIEGGRLVYSL